MERSSQWRLAADIVVDGEKRGEVEVYYLEERPEAYEGPFLREEWDLIEGIAHTLSEGAERRQAREREERQVQRLTALRTVDMAITGSMDLRVTLNILLDQATTHLNVDAADVLQLNIHTRELEYVAGRGFSSSAISRFRVSPGEGLAGRAVVERRTLDTPNLASSGDTSERAGLLKSEGFVACYATPLVAKGQARGVLEIFHRSPLDPDEQWGDFLEALAGQAAVAIDSTAMFEDVQQSKDELLAAYDATLEGWARGLELRDLETEGHSQRVCDSTVRLARALGISEAELVSVRRGALLHDVGKIGVPDSILLKPGPLTDEEWEIMRRHPVYAFEWLSSVAYLRSALDIPYCHHEKWDGTGYPRGLKGEEIPLAARIFAVVDVWDALSSDRPYREAWPKEKVREHIQDQAGTHFDPRVVEAFLLIER